jgi:NAD(P)H-hydrate repair Nnr-like enzyme with NAD(P)H-hydrate dehydratase domain
MQEFNPSQLKNLYIPPPGSHKGQNGKLLLIGGSELFHAASLWSLKVASRIVDMVFYASVPVNNQIVLQAKSEFRDGIVVPRENIEDYIEEADCVLIGPGMVRSAEPRISNFKFQISNLGEIEKIEDEGIQTYTLTKYLLTKYPKKRWVIDGGALQMIEKDWLKDMPEVILTPHHQEFERVFGLPPNPENVEKMAQEHNVVILRKGQEDIVCGPFDEVHSEQSPVPSGTGQSRTAQGEIRSARISGGNAGMTKGGTGDVLAGLVAALACKNDLFLSAAAGSYINKKAGDELFKRVGISFNASDLVEEIPKVMHKLLS